MNNPLINEIIEKLTNHTEGYGGLFYHITPFTTKSKNHIRDNFKFAMAEFSREVTNRIYSDRNIKNKFSVTQDNLDLDESYQAMIDHIIESVVTEDEDIRSDLKWFMANYLFENNDIKITSPYLYNFLEVKNSNIKSMGTFLKDILVDDTDMIKKIFIDSTSNQDVLKELIYTQSTKLMVEKKAKKVYVNLLPRITELYNEDISYLYQHKDFFVKNFELLTYFYAFMYLSQLILKFERYEKADYETLIPLYFSLDWERLNKHRRPAGSIFTYKDIKNKKNNFFVHVHTLTFLSCNNSTLKVNETYKVQTYREIYNHIENELLNKHDYIDSLNYFIKEYKSKFKNSDQEILLNADLSINDIFKTMFQLVNSGVNIEARNNYGRQIRDLGAGRFIKNRGSMGFVLNIKSDFLILLIAVSVKEKRIKLSQLFEEFKKRGIEFDQKSKIEVIEFLEKLNLLDKKSDSGDAQYVKSIL